MIFLLCTIKLFEFEFEFELQTSSTGGGGGGGGGGQRRVHALRKNRIWIEWQPKSEFFYFVLLK